MGYFLVPVEVPGPVRSYPLTFLNKLLCRLPASLLVSLGLLLCSPQVWAETYRFPMPAKLYAIGDIHGDLRSAQSLLEQAELVDGKGNWQGGEAVLVSVGDLLDRGPDSRAVIEWFIRLQQQAQSAGGRVAVLLGNHEQMNLTEELRYVTAEDFADYLQEEQKPPQQQQRQAALQRFAAAKGSKINDAVKAQFDQQYPPGYFGQRSLFAPDGVLGSWLFQRPVMLVFGDIGFVHGGLSAETGAYSPEQLNRDTIDVLQTLVSTQQRLAAQGIDLSPLSFYARQDRVKQLINDSDDNALKSDARAWLQASQSPLLDSTGPLWYRGNVLCHPWYQGDLLDSLFQRWQIQRLVVGHTPTQSRHIESHLDGRLINADTGLNKAYYNGNATLLALHGDTPREFVSGQWQALTPNHFDQIHGHSFSEWEQRLRQAKVIGTKPVGEGVTKPLKVELTLDDERFLAVFKYEDIRPSRSRNKQHQLSDSYRFELASYGVDQLMQLNMVPPVVERRIEGRNGALQLWIDDLINERQRRDQDRFPAETCVLSEQVALLNIFDILLHNDDRTMQNILWQLPSFRLWFIDQSRAFRTYEVPPDYLNNTNLRGTPTLIRRLEQLDFESVTEATSSWLDSRQRRALLKRRDWLLRQMQQE